MNISVASLDRVRSFSRTIESIIVPISISQPLNERAVSGVNCQGKMGMSKFGKMKTRIAPMVSALPQMANSRFNPKGSGSSDAAELDAAFR